MSKFRIEKLKASDYKNFEALYTRLKLIKSVANSKTVNVSNIFVSDKDMKKFEQELTKQAKKRGYSGRAVKLSVGLEMLNLSPSGALGKILKEGFVLIAEEA